MAKLTKEQKKQQKAIKEAEAKQLAFIKNSQKLEEKALKEEAKAAGLSSSEINSLLKNERAANKTEYSAAKTTLKADGLQTLPSMLTQPSTFDATTGYGQNVTNRITSAVGMMNQYGISPGRGIEDGSTGIYMTQIDKALRSYQDTGSFGSGVVGRTLDLVSKAQNGTLTEADMGKYAGRIKEVKGSPGTYKIQIGDRSGDNKNFSTTYLTKNDDGSYKIAAVDKYQYEAPEEGGLFGNKLLNAAAVVAAGVLGGPALAQALTGTLGATGAAIATGAVMGGVVAPSIMSGDLTFDAKGALLGGAGAGLFQYGDANGWFDPVKNAWSDFSGNTYASQTAMETATQSMGDYASQLQEAVNSGSITLEQAQSAMAGHVNSLGAQGMFGPNWTPVDLGTGTTAPSTTTPSTTAPSTTTPVDTTAPTTGTTTGTTGAGSVDDIVNQATSGGYTDPYSSGTITNQSGMATVTAADLARMQANGMDITGLAASSGISTQAVAAASSALASGATTAAANAAADAVVGGSQTTGTSMTGGSTTDGGVTATGGVADATAGLWDKFAAATGLSVGDLKGMLGTGASALGSYFTAEQAQKAAETQANAQIEAAKIAAEAARFKPVGVSTRFGKSDFTFDDKGNLLTAGYTLDPTIKAQQDQLMTASGGLLSQFTGAQAATAPMQTAANSLFSQGATGLQRGESLLNDAESLRPTIAKLQAMGLPYEQAIAQAQKMGTDAMTESQTMFGQATQLRPTIEKLQALGLPYEQAAARAMELSKGYMAANPLDQAQKYYQDQQKVLSYGRDQELMNLESRLASQGRLGLSIGGGNGMLAANPEMAALYNARTQQDRELAAAATRGGMEYAQFGAGMAGTAADLQNRMFQLQSQAYDPYKTAMGAATQLGNYGMGMQQNAQGLQQGIFNLQSQAYDPYKTAMGVGMDYSKFGAAQTGLGGNMLRDMYATQTAAYDPYKTAIGGAAYLEGLGQNALDQSINIGAKGTAGAQQAGALIAQGMTNAANTMQPANAYSPWGSLFSGLGNTLTSQYKFDPFTGKPIP